MPPPQPRMTDRSEPAGGDPGRRGSAVAARPLALGLAPLVGRVGLLALCAGEARPREDVFQSIALDRTCHDALLFGRWCIGTYYITIILHILQAFV